jgi:hypothetical protein
VAGVPLKLGDNLSSHRSAGGARDEVTLTRWLPPDAGPPDAAGGGGAVREAGRPAV